MRLWVAELVAVRSPTWLYLRLPDRLRSWCAAVRTREYARRWSR